MPAMWLVTVVVGLIGSLFAPLAAVSFPFPIRRRILTTQKLCRHLPVEFRCYSRVREDLLQEGRRRAQQSLWRSDRVKLLKEMMRCDPYRHLRA